MITSKPSPGKVEPHHSGDDSMSAPVCEPMVDLRRRRSLIGFSIFGILLLAVFSKSLFSLMTYVAGQELHSHILLIPLVSAYLIYIRRSSLPTDYTFSPGWAMIPLVAGVIALAAARVSGLFGQPLSHNDYLTLIALSFVSFLAAGGFFFLGRKWMAAV